MILKDFLLLDALLDSSLEQLSLLLDFLWKIAVASLADAKEDFEAHLYEIKIDDARPLAVLGRKDAAVILQYVVVASLVNKGSLFYLQSFDWNDLKHLKSDVHHPNDSEA